MTNKVELRKETQEDVLAVYTMLHAAAMAAPKQVSAELDVIINNAKALTAEVLETVAVQYREEFGDDALAGAMHKIVSTLEALQPLEAGK